eukprot:CAMPEP_0168213276 /NCGR_PEP_ID=MMETSP0140_2-20121125/4711_1 /TAXON_ID=44445 /ORGANISM="Pseudo-nitzschia australis, Strain 10249 10 AB" /LENGTH=739 /DNA_ID=CAMNT_0008140121 /DNA_START=94 /DNA_END=2309 /DNA_ORIENTATION=-
MFSSSLTVISRRLSSRGGTGAAAQNCCRFMGTSSKNKKKAMQRQRKLDAATASNSTDMPQEYSEECLSSSSSLPTPPQSTRIISDPVITSSGGTFDRTANLSKLQLRLRIDDYLEKYDLSDDYHGASSSSNDNSSIGNNSAAPTWESNKLIAPPTLGGSVTGAAGLLMRSSSTLATGKNQNRNILNDQDDDGFLVDRDSMFDPAIHLPHAPKDWKGYEPSTPLSDFLMQRIGVSGQPISTAEYMRHALTHPLYGYYTSKEYQNENPDDDSDGWDDDDYDVDVVDASETETKIASEGRSTIFGRGGDFVTAPELSSVFGHSLCVWFMTIWQQEPLGKPSDIQFVELGPGRGTLIADLLELAHSSKLMNFGQAIRTVHLVEASIELRREQQATLKKALSHLIRLEFVDDGWESNSDKKEDDKQDDRNNNKNNDGEDDVDDKTFVNTIRIEWHNDFSSFQSKRDKSIPTMVVMQEFLDALPVHQFQKTEDGWRERMIDVVSADETNEAGEPVPTTPIDPNKSSEDGSNNRKELIPRLRQVLAPNITPAVDLLLSSSYDQYAHFPEGTVVEICPDALFLIQDVGKVLEESQGAALIVDYGEEGTTDTLRAFSRHQQVPLTSRPGQVDVTADVDFFAIKNCLSVDAFKKSQGTSTGTANEGDADSDAKEIVPSSIHAFGPVPQGEFLMKMGAGELTMNAIEKEETTEEQAQAFADALKYLVMPEHMGQKFKVLALSRKRDDLFG